MGFRDISAVPPSSARKIEAECSSRTCRSTRWQPDGQATKKQGRVLRRRETSCLARLDHSRLELLNGALNCAWGVFTACCLSEGVDVFRPGPLLLTWGRSHHAVCPFMRKLWLGGGASEGWTRTRWYLTAGLCDFGEVILAEGLYDFVQVGVPL
jgi:hypothetical protein